MKKIIVVELSMLFAFALLFPVQSFEAKPKTNRDKNIEWISKQVNTYGQATGLFYLGKGGAYWACHQIDVKSDSLQIVALYRHRSLDTLAIVPQTIRFEDISYVETDERPIPVIELSGRYGKRFTLILDLIKRQNVKKQLVKAFGELIEQNKEKDQLGVRK